MDTIFYTLTTLLFGFIVALIFNRVRTIENKFTSIPPFKKVLVGNMLYIFCEIIDGLFAKGKLITGKYIYMILVNNILIANVALSLLWVLFTVNILFNKNSRLHKVFKTISWSVTGVTILMILVNNFIPFLFTINPDNTTTNTKAILIPEILDKINLFSMFACGFIAFFRKTSERHYAVTVLIYSTLFIAMNSLKFQFFNYPIYSAIYSISSFIVYALIMTYEVSELWTSAQNEKVLIKDNSSLEKNYSIVNTLAGTFDYVAFINVDKREVNTIRYSGPFKDLFPMGSVPVAAEEFDNILRSIIPREDFTQFLADVQREKVMDAIKGGKRFFTDFRLKFDDVIEYYRIYFVMDTDNSSNVLIGIRNNENEHKLMTQVENQKLYISNLEVQNEMAVLMASIDGLTGLLNKISFIEKVERYITDNTSKHCALIFFDMDHFKSINDVFGHAKGDTALREMADKLKKMFRANELISRMGGDEFCVFLPNITEKLVRERLDLMNRQLKAVYEDDAATIKTSVSIGCIYCENENLSYIKMHNEADKAMYEVKDRGRDGHIIKIF